MTPLRNILSVTILPLLMFSFSQCSSQKKLQEKAPMELSEVFCQRWAAGIQEGGTGMNIYIPVEAISEGGIKLDSVYFRGQSAKLITMPISDSLYVGRFVDKGSKKPDLVMSSDPKEEYGNEMPKAEEKIPFELKDNECVISYIVGSERKYFKIQGVVEKTPLHYPMSPKQ